MSAQDVERLRTVLGSPDWMDAVITCAAPGVVAERVGFGEPDAVYRGRAGLREWFRELQEVHADFRLEPEAYLDLGEQTLVLSAQQGRGRYSGALVTMPIAQIFRWCNEKLVHIKTYGSREDALRELGLTQQSLQPTDA